MIRRFVAVAVVVSASTAAAIAPAAHAEITPNGTPYHAITFPVRESVSYFDDFGGVRHHNGNDLMGKKLDHLLAAASGTIDWIRVDTDGTRRSGNMLSLKADDGWTYWYIHINNDTPGTDDGKNPPAYRFAPGITTGVHVARGQFIAYMGDSGEAETTDPHLHFEMHSPHDTVIDPYTSLRLAQGAGANGLCAYPKNPPPHPNPAAGRGFWTLGADGKVLPFGTVKSYGSPPAPTTATNPYVALGSTITGNGYWITDTLGTVRPYGDAVQYGGTAKLRLNQPVIGITPTATGKGYWLMAKDGGIFSFGDARFYGSTGNLHLNAPIIGMGATAGGKGYWLLGADGGIFSFGDARFYGSTGNLHLTTTMQSMTATPTGLGYWLLSRTGRIYRFGDALWYGSVPGTGWCVSGGALGMARTATAHGLWVLLSDGRIVSLGDANAWGQPASVKARPVAIAGSPTAG